MCLCLHFLKPVCLAQEERTTKLLEGNLLCRVLVVVQISLCLHAVRVLRTPMSGFISAVYSADILQTQHCVCIAKARSIPVRGRPLQRLSLGFVIIHSSNLSP